MSDGLTVRACSRGCKAPAFFDASCLVGDSTTGGGGEAGMPGRIEDFEIVRSLFHQLHMALHDVTFPGGRALSW